MQTFTYKYIANPLDTIIPFKKFQNYENILIQIFCGENKKTLKKIINELDIHLPNAIIIGTSTDGEIDNTNIYTHSTIISISIFKSTSIKSAFIEGDNSYDNGIYLANRLIKNDTKLLILFADGTFTNGEEFLKGIESVNNSVKICGGMAGDNGKFTQTFICSGKNIINKGAVGVALNSDVLKVINDYTFNWSPIGIEHTIDEINDNRVYKISGLTPVEFYTKYLGEQVANALPSTGIEFPFIIEKNGFNIARAVISKHSDGSLSFAGNLKVGDKVRLGFGNAEMIMKNSYDLSHSLEDKNSQTFFIYSCMARRRYMPNLINLEIEPYVKIAPTVGFFSYAEFFHNNGHNELLNQTFTAVGLCEVDCDKKKNNLSKTPKHTLEESEYARTIGALTHLIEQSAKDYDIQRKVLQEEKNYSHSLLESQDQFIKYAVHETNTPLSVIMNNVELYEMEFGKNPYLSNIEAAMKNVFNIYDDLSFLIKNKTIEHPKHKIDLVDFLRSRIDFFDIVAKKARLSMLFCCEFREFFLNFNETKLQRIIDNNITNAIKYTLDKERIFIKLLKTPNGCRITFESKSSQIENPTKVFEQFYRENSKKKGLGLGLNLVKDICDKHGIEISVESNETYTAFSYDFFIERL